jgi:hypothetical protein
MKISWKKSRRFGNPSMVPPSNFSPIQFHHNLKREKQVSIKWSGEKRKKDERLLVEIEDQLECCYNREGHGFLTNEQKNEIKLLEDKRRKILMDKEKEWRIKSRAIWLHARDENTKFFHHFANCPEKH